MYEVGAKYDTSRLLLSLDYFYQKVDRDFGFFEFQSGPMNGDALYTNDGQREFKGVEAAATWQVMPDIQLHATASHLLAKYLQTTLASVTIFQDQFGLAQKGTPNTGIPDWLANVSLDYTKSSLLLDDDRFGLIFGMLYTGKQATTYDLNGFQNVGFIPGVGNATGSIAQRYLYYNVTAGDTTYDPNGGISPFAVFNLDMNYLMPTPQLPMLKSVKFDLNIQEPVRPALLPVFLQADLAGIVRQTLPVGRLPAWPRAITDARHSFSDALPGQPFTVIFTVTARF